MLIIMFITKGMDIHLKILNQNRAGESSIIYMHVQNLINPMLDGVYL